MIEPDWIMCQECDGTGVIDGDGWDYGCENCEGEGRVDANSLPRSRCQPADRPRECADTPRIDSGA
jgi:DnaJ-class molecular chaperone